MRRIGGFVQAAFAALWLVRASLAIGGRAEDVLIAVSGVAVIGVVSYAIRTTAGAAPRPAGPEARRIERSVTVATVIELVAAFVLPVIVIAASRSDWHALLCMTSSEDKARALSAACSSAIWRHGACCPSRVIGMAWPHTRPPWPLQPTRPPIWPGCDTRSCVIASIPAVTAARGTERLVPWSLPSALPWPVWLGSSWRPGST